VCFAIFRSIKALYVCLDEQEAYDPIVLQTDEIMAHCKKYFEEHPDDYSPTDFRNTLCFVTPKKYKVQLSFATMVRAMKCFYKELSDREGFDLDNSTIGKLSIDTTTNMPIDHEGQEMDLGDDTETGVIGDHVPPSATPGSTYVV
jgi:hypothetical protein